MKMILVMLGGLFWNASVWAETTPVRVEIGQVVGMPSDTVKVPILIHAPFSLSGIAFTMIYENTDIAYLSSQKVATPFEVFESGKAGAMRYIFLNPNTDAVLGAGLQMLVEMTFKISNTAIMGEIKIDGQNLMLTNGQYPLKELGGIFIAGKIVVTDQCMRLKQEEWISQDVMRLGIDLYHTQEVSAIQMILRWSDSSVVFKDIHTTQWTNLWQVFSHPRIGSVGVVLADLSGNNPLSKGQDKILELDLSYLGDGELLGNLEIDSLIVSDGSGKIMAISSYPLQLNYAGRDVIVDVEIPIIEDENGQDNDTMEEDASDEVEGGDEEYSDLPESEDVLEDDPRDNDGQEKDDSNLPSQEQQVRDKKEFQVKIVEILADPPSGLLGDVNGDGLRDSRQDEFVEIMNMGSETVNLGGWRLSDDDVALEAMFEFEEHVQIQAGERIVVFGGGKNEKVSGQVFIDDGSIGNGLTNGGDTLILLNALGDTIDMVAFGSEGGKNQSLNRVGDRFVLHSQENGRTLFSPNMARPVVDLAFPLPSYREIPSGQISGMGAYVLYTDKKDFPIPKEDVYWVSSDSLVVKIMPDGTFEAKQPGVVEVWFAWNGMESLHASIRVVPMKESGSMPMDQIDGIVVSEIHANPDEGENGDTNGDGVRDGYQDEFIEILNIGKKDVDLSGWYLGDNTKLSGLFRFPQDTSLQPGQYLTLFGGGEVRNVSGLTFVDDGRIGDGLSNSGDVIRLISPDGEYTALEIVFGASTKGVSLKRSGLGELVPHNALPYYEHFSPNDAGAILTSLNVQANQMVGGENDTLKMIANGIFSNNVVSDVTRQVKWDVNPPQALLDNGLISLSGEGTCQVAVTFGEVKSDWVHLVFRAPNFEGADTTAYAPSQRFDIEQRTDRIKKNLILTEIHANPGRGELGDTNGNGTRETYGDEFLEFYNNGTDTLDLSFCRIVDDRISNAKFFEFPANSLLPPQAYVVIWGEKEKLEMGQLSAMGRLGDGLSNDGEQICLLAPMGSTCLLSWQYVGSYAGDSWISDGQGGWKRHSELPSVENLSPGRESRIVVQLQTKIHSKQLQVGENVILKVSGVLNNGMIEDLSHSVVWETGSDIVTIIGDVLDANAAGQTFIRPVWGDWVGENVDIVVIALGSDDRDSTAFDHFEGGTNNFPPHLVDEKDKKEDKKYNHAPVFVNRADTVALAGLNYIYEPIINDEDGDSVWVWHLEKPDWLQDALGRFEGVVPFARQDTFAFSMAVTDGQDTTFQNQKINVLAVESLGGHLAQQTLLVGSEYPIIWPFPDHYEWQIDGDWEWKRELDAIMIRPNEIHSQMLGVGVSVHGNSVYHNWLLNVLPRPKLTLLGVVLIPIEDHNKDGHVDMFEDQMIFIKNSGNLEVDVSNWYVGELNKTYAQIPPNTLLLPGDVLKIYGSIDPLSDRQSVSSRGKIGDGLSAGDIMVLMTENFRDTLIYESIPKQQNGKILQKSEGRWVPMTTLEGFESVENHRVIDMGEGSNGDTLSIVTVEGGNGFKSFAPRPNPFHDQTQFEFYSIGGSVQVTVYSVLGQPVRQIVNEVLPNGYYSRVWDGRDNTGNVLSTGVYLIHFNNVLATYTYPVALLK